MKSGDVFLIVPLTSGEGFLPMPSCGTRKNGERKRSSLTRPSLLAPKPTHKRGGPGERAISSCWHIWSTLTGSNFNQNYILLLSKSLCVCKDGTMSSFQVHLYHSQAPGEDHRLDPCRVSVRGSPGPLRHWEILLSSTGSGHVPLFLFFPIWGCIFRLIGECLILFLKEYWTS